MKQGRGGALKLLMSSRSLLHQRDGGAQPAAAAASAGFLPFILKLFSTSTSTAETPPSILVRPISSHHRRNAWQHQVPPHTTTSTGSSSSCTFTTTTSVKACILVVLALLFSILLQLIPITEPSDLLLNSSGWMPSSSHSASQAGSETTARGTTADGGASSSEGSSMDAEEAESCSREVLKVFVYDIPLAFSAGFFEVHFRNHDANWEAALGSNQTVRMLSELARMPEWRGGSLIRKQYSAEHFLTADIMAAPAARSPMSHAIRVLRPEAADVFFVPFYSSILFDRFRHRRQDILQGAQKWLLHFLLSSPWWQRSSGSDHVIPAAHPLALASIRDHLPDAIYVVVDFWLYASHVSNLTKDVVTPHHHLQPYFSEEEELLRLSNVTSVPLNTNMAASSVKAQQQQQQQEDEEGAAAAFSASLWSLRDILVYFRGRVDRSDDGKLRDQLLDVLRDEPDAFVGPSIPTNDAIQNSAAELQRARFCLHIVGDTPSSCRFLDIVASGCVPVVISDHLELPFESSIDYSDLAVFISQRDALQRGYLMNFVRNISEQSWADMQHKMRSIWHHLEFNQPSKAEDAVDMIWKEIKFRRCKHYGNLFENRLKRLKKAKLL